MESKKIPLKEFISRLENNGNAILKNCIRQNTQFSTQFIIQRIIAQNEDRLKTLQQDKSIIEKPLLPEDWIMQQNWDLIQSELKSRFDLDNLNFLEANQMAMRLNEYMIGIYQSIQLKISNTAVKKVLGAVIRRITSTNAKLKKEHLRLSAES
jgi:hypothetical protein